MNLLFLLLPWLIVAAYLVVMIRVPTGLLPRARWAAPPPPVSIIVPARNEEANIAPLLRSLTALHYPDFEVIVVDDQSSDRTRDVTLEASGSWGGTLRLLEGKPLPVGWFGKPWACHQGSLEADGDLLLFTDADTIHEPDLLDRAVRTLLEEEADALTVVGRQIMGSFWERLLQPQFFALLAFRFPRSGTTRGPGGWRHAIANGQYLLFHREVYGALGGHEAVRGEVVEDMRLAHLLAREGQRLVVREGPGLETRMYTSLRSLVEGWSKNIATGALQTVPGWMIHLILPISFLLGFLLWLLPPLVLAWALATQSGGTSLAFGAVGTGFGVLFWGFATAFMGGNPLYGLLYPVGAVVSAYIFLLSWVRGSRISWKGRDYVMPKKARLGGGGDES